MNEGVRHQEKTRVSLCKTPPCLPRLEIGDEEHPTLTCTQALTSSTTWEGEAEADLKEPDVQEPRPG